MGNCYQSEQQNQQPNRMEGDIQNLEKENLFLHQQNEILNKEIREEKQKSARLVQELQDENKKLKEQIEKDKEQIEIFNKLKQVLRKNIQSKLNIEDILESNYQEDKYQLLYQQYLNGFN